jgi:integrase
MRIGEAFGTKSVRPIARLPRRVLWRGKEQEPKTQNAIRDIETPEPLARLLRARVAGKSGYLFTTASGKPLSQRNALRTLHTTGKVGFHAFRRFRTETLRKERVPEDLIALWLGHSKKTVTDLYATGLKEKEILSVATGMVRQGWAWFVA